VVALCEANTTFAEHLLKSCHKIGGITMAKKTSKAWFPQLCSDSRYYKMMSKTRGMTETTTPACMQEVTALPVAPAIPVGKKRKKRLTLNRLLVILGLNHKQKRYLRGIAKSKVRI
jgi:hypothetical protein